MSQSPSYPTDHIPDKYIYSLIRIFLALALILGIGIICIAPTILELPYRLIFGWIHFIRNNSPQISINQGQLIIGLISISGLIAALELFLCKSLNHNFSIRHLIKTTLALLIFVLLFFSGIALSGFLAQLIFLRNSPEPIWVNRFNYHMSRSSIYTELKHSLINYQEVHHELPPIGTYDQQGNALHGWLTLLLPHIGVNNFGEIIDLSKSWDDPFHHDVMQHDYFNFKKIKRNWTLEEPEKYVGSPVAANPYVMGINKPVKLEDIPDGSSNVFIIGTVYKKMSAWGDPHNYRDPKLGINQSEKGFGHPEKHSMYVIMADGSVRYISSRDNQELQNWMKMAMPNDGEPLDKF